MKQELLIHIFTDYSKYLQEEKALAEKTCQGYLLAARKYLRLCTATPEAFFLPTQWKWEDLDKRSVEVYLNHLRQDRSWKERSLAQHTSAINSFFGYLLKRGLVTRNPARNLQPQYLRGPLKSPKGAEESMRKLFTPRNNTLTDARTLLVMELIFGAGFRPSKAFRVQGLSPAPNPTSTEDASQASLRVELPEGVQEITVTKAGLARATAYLKLRADVVMRRDAEVGTTGKLGEKSIFWVNNKGAPRSEQQLSADVKMAMERAGLEGKPSRLWQLAGQHFIDKGGDIRSAKTLLGAKNLGSVERYLEKDPTEWLRLLRKIHPRQTGK